MRHAHGRGRAVRGHRDGGFTLIELMVIVVVIGALATAAVVYIKPSSYASTARGYADQIASLAEAARDRAIATHAWQRLIVSVDEVDGTGYPSVTSITTKQASSTGYTKPDDGDDCPNGVAIDPDNPPVPPCWMHMGRLSSPMNGVAIISSDATPHLEPGTPPGDGTGLPVNLDYAPDGSAQGLTLFVGDASRKGLARVLVFSVTGTALVYDTW